MKGQYPEMWVTIYQIFLKEYNKDPESLQTCVIRMLQFEDGGRVGGEGVDGSRREETRKEKRGNRGRCVR